MGPVLYIVLLSAYTFSSLSYRNYTIQWQNVCERSKHPDQIVTLKNEQKVFISTRDTCTTQLRGVLSCLVKVGGNPYGLNQTQIEILEFNYKGPIIYDCIYGGFSFINAETGKIYYTGCETKHVWFNHPFSFTRDSYYIFFLSYLYSNKLFMTINLLKSGIDGLPESYDLHTFSALTSMSPLLSKRPNFKHVKQEGEKMIFMERRNVDELVD